jgi:hypothetical protein
VEKRDVLGLGNTVSSGLGAAGGALAGLLGSVASAVNPNDKRPDAAHPFQVSSVAPSLTLFPPPRQPHIVVGRMLIIV